MKQTVSYKAYITNKRLSLQPTLDIYREAVSFIVDVIHLEWDTFKGLTLKETYNKVEKFIHTTKGNTASYDFDIKLLRLNCICSMEV